MRVWPSGRANGWPSGSGPPRVCPAWSREVLGVFTYDFCAAVARRQRSGPVFLVGDAAHRTTPRGATGMNTGIADGHNLGWKLAWVVRGWADEPLLDTYEAERAPVGRANAAASLESRQGSDFEQALAQDFGVRYVSGAVLGDHVLTGRRAPARLGQRRAAGRSRRWTCSATG